MGRRRCAGCEEPECLRCSDVVISGLVRSDERDGDARAAAYDDDGDPMDRVSAAARRVRDPGELNAGSGGSIHLRRRP